MNQPLKVSGELEQRIEARFDKVGARFDKLEHDSEKRHHQLVSYLSLEARMNKVGRVLETPRRTTETATLVNEAGVFPSPSYKNVLLSAH
jgi:hypothetical protein